MANRDYNSPETIFTIPSDISEMEKLDAISLSIERIKGTIMTTAQLMNTNGEFSSNAVRDCLLGAYAQLEILDKLTKHNAKKSAR